MKNTTHLKEDGSRWTMLFGETAQSKFKAWGVNRIHAVDEQDSGGRGRNIFMIELEDGWHYAHSDGCSVYAAASVFQTPDGESAWWAHELQVAVNHRISAEKHLQDAISEERAMQNKYARSIQSPAPESCR